MHLCPRDPFQMTLNNKFISILIFSFSHRDHFFYLASVFYFIITKVRSSLIENYGIYIYFVFNVHLLKTTIIKKGAFETFVLKLLIFQSAFYYIYQFLCKIIMSVMTIAVTKLFSQLPDGFDCKYVRYCSCDLLTFRRLCRWQQEEASVVWVWSVYHSNRIRDLSSSTSHHWKLSLR